MDYFKKTGITPRGSVSKVRGSNFNKLKINKHFVDLEHFVWILVFVVAVQVGKTHLRVNPTQFPVYV